MWKPFLTPKTIAARSKQLLGERKAQQSQDELNQPIREVVKQFVEAEEMDEYTVRDEREDDLSQPLLPAIELADSMDVDGDERPLTEVSLSFEADVVESHADVLFRAPG